MRKLHQICLLIAFVCLATGVARAQSFRVQCPTATITHPTATNNNSEPAYTAPTFTSGQTYVTSNAGHVNGAIKSQQISGGDGYAAMGDGAQTYLFSFGPLSGLADIANGQPGTEFPNVFNSLYSDSAGKAGTFLPGDPATTVNAGSGPNPVPIAITYNGAVGLVPDPNALPIHPV